MEDIFFNKKPVMALVTIRREEEAYGTQVARQIDTTYSHTVKIISRLEDRGLVETEKKGRKKILSLSDEGKTYSEVFIQLLNIFEETARSTEKEDGKTLENASISG